MSKSKGNVVAPQKVSDTLGAEILRLWVAATDYSGELSISDEILKRVVESYRRIRNTLRFLLANTSDFNSATDAIAIDQLLEIDRYAIARMAHLQEEIRGHFNDYEFHPVVAKLQMYCSEDLGGFYLDILKDRLYTSGVSSMARRSAQTALWHITQSLLRLIAPVLSFTAEEAWAALGDEDVYHASGETIFTQQFHALPAINNSAALLARYEALREIRAGVLKQLEEVRASGAIGSSLQADVEIHASGEKLTLLQSLGDDLKFVLITSAARVIAVNSEADEKLIVTPSAHAKCERCWHYRADVGMDTQHPSICGRCVANLFGGGESRHIA
jgi:isoleucyl-tRNA synthetase